MENQVWVKLTQKQKDNLKPHISEIYWKDEGGNPRIGPLWVSFKDGTIMRVAVSSFNPTLAKWYTEKYAQQLANSLGVPLRIQ